LPPAIIQQDKKRIYLEYLQEYQLKGNSIRLEKFIIDAVLKSFDEIEF